MSATYLPDEAAAVRLIADGMPMKLRSLRGLELLWIPNGIPGSGEVVCPACSGRGSLTDMSAEPEPHTTGQRLLSSLARCPLCHGFATVPRGCADYFCWVLQRAQALQHEHGAGHG